MISFYNAINCFTDCSIIKLKNGKKLAVAGYISMYRGEILSAEYKPMYDCTNNFGELYGIYMGISNLVKWGRDSDKFLNLFSDSLISINSLRDWIFNWRVVTHNDLINKTGKVANQEIIKAIVCMVERSGYHMQLFHLLSHLNSSVPEQLWQVKNRFAELNNTILTDDITREIMYYNSEVDHMTRDIGKRLVKDNMFDPYTYYKPYFINRVITDGSIRNYRKLIRGEKEYGKIYSGN